MTNKLVLWDLDGTITDSFSWAKEKTRIQFKNDFGWDVEENLIKKYFNNGWENFTKCIAKELNQNITDQQVKDFVKKGFEEKNNAKLPILPNAIKHLTYLKDNQIKLALTSNNNEDDLKKVLKNNNLDIFFEIVIGYDSVKKPKPSGEMYLKACEICNTPITETVVIEDSVTGMKASHHAKIPVVAVCTGTQKKDALQKYNPTIIVQNLTHITTKEILNLKYKK